jgi:hypothetical protein
VSFASFRQYYFADLFAQSKLKHYLCSRKIDFMVKVYGYALYSQRCAGRIFSFLNNNDLIERSWQ